MLLPTHYNIGKASGLGTTEAPTADWHNTIRMGHGSHHYPIMAIHWQFRMTGTGVGDIYTQALGNGTSQGWKKALE